MLALVNWLIRVQKTNLAYYKNRKDLMIRFADIISNVRGRDSIQITSSDYNIIWLYLTTRNDKITDDANLNFTNTITTLFEQIDSGDEDDQNPSQFENEQAVVRGNNRNENNNAVQSQQSFRNQSNNNNSNVAGVQASVVRNNNNPLVEGDNIPFNNPSPKSQRLGDQQD